jgi:riboflavin transporter FmnP
MKCGDDFWEETMKKRMSTAYMTYLALMIALSIMLNYFPEIPLAFFAPWLKLDFSFVPMLLIGFSLGPVASVIALVITNLVHLLGTTTFGVGQLANIIIGLCFLLPPTMMYRKKRVLKTAIIGTVLGTLLMTVAGLLANKFILVPALLGDKIAGFDMAGYLFTAIVPFNLLKGTINGAITFLLYKRLSGVLKDAERECDVNTSPDQ